MVAPSGLAQLESCRVPGVGDDKLSPHSLKTFAAWITWFILVPQVFAQPPDININEPITQIILRADFCETWSGGTRSLLQEYTADYETTAGLHAKLRSQPQLDTSDTTPSGFLISLRGFAKRRGSLNPFYLLGRPELIVGKTTIRSTGKGLVLVIVPDADSADEGGERSNVLLQITAAPEGAKLVSVSSKGRFEHGRSVSFTIDPGMLRSIVPRCRFFIDGRTVLTVMGLAWERPHPEKPEVVLIPESEALWRPNTIGADPLPKQELDAFREAWRAVLAHVNSEVTTESVRAILSEDHELTRSISLPQGWLADVPMQFLYRAGRSAIFSQTLGGAYPLPPAAKGGSLRLIVEAVYDRPTRSITTIYIGVGSQ